MSAHDPATSGRPKAAEADLLGEAVALPVPAPELDVATQEKSKVPLQPVMPEPPAAEDENQPGFIGERNRPAP